MARVFSSATIIINHVLLLYELRTKDYRIVMRLVHRARFARMLPLSHARSPQDHKMTVLYLCHKHTKRRLQRDTRTDILIMFRSARGLSSFTHPRGKRKNTDNRDLLNISPQYLRAHWINAFHGLVQVDDVVL